MRISGTDKNVIFEKYMMLNENLSNSPGTPKELTVTSIGSSGPVIPRSPIAALKGEVSSTNTATGEDAEENCEDEAIEMAKGQLLVAADKALHLVELLNSTGELEPWAAAKITLASDYIESVADYMGYNEQAHEGEHEDEDHSIQIETDDETVD